MLFFRKLFSKIIFLCEHIYVWAYICFLKFSKIIFCVWVYIFFFDIMIKNCFDTVHEFLNYRRATFLFHTLWHLWNAYPACQVSVWYYPSTKKRACKLALRTCNPLLSTLLRMSSFRTVFRGAGKVVGAWTAHRQWTFEAEAVGQNRVCLVFYFVTMWQFIEICTNDLV